MPAARTAFRTTARLAPAAGLALLSACVGVNDQLATLRQYNAISASPSTTPDYDWSVLIRNLEPLGVDMSKVGRERLAVGYLGDKCPNGTIVSETEMATTMPGLRQTSKDYAVRVKC